MSAKNTHQAKAERRKEREDRKAFTPTPVGKYVYKDNNKYTNPGDT